MIKLNVKDYCHDCPNFEAEQQRSILYSEANIIECMSDCIIYCKHKNTCYRIEDYLSKRFLDEQFSKENIHI